MSIALALHEAASGAACVFQLPLQLQNTPDSFYKTANSEFLSHFQPKRQFIVVPVPASNVFSSLVFLLYYYVLTFNHLGLTHCKEFNVWCQSFKSGK